MKTNIECGSIWTHKTEGWEGRVVLLDGQIQPRDVVEQELLEPFGRQVFEFDARPVEHDRLQSSDFGIYVQKRHGG